MSKVLRYSFLVIGLGFLVSTFSVSEAKAQNVLTEILRRMDLNNKTLQSLQASVTMAKHNPQLKVTDTLAGFTSYLPQTKKTDRYMLIDWKTENGRPMEESILVIGDKYELYRKRANQVLAGKVDSAKNNASAGGALGFMSMSKDQLRKNYKVSFIAEEQLKDGTKTARLLLTPLKATSYKTAELWVDGNGMPLQAKITEQNDDTTTVLLENVDKNKTLKVDEIFRLNYPGNASRKKV